MFLRLPGVEGSVGEGALFPVAEFGIKLHFGAL